MQRQRCRWTVGGSCGQFNAGARRRQTQGPFAVSASLLSSSHQQTESRQLLFAPFLKRRMGRNPPMPTRWGLLWSGDANFRRRRPSLLAWRSGRTSSYRVFPCLHPPAICCILGPSDGSFLRSLTLFLYWQKKGKRQNRVPCPASDSKDRIKEELACPINLILTVRLAIDDQ